MKKITFKPVLTAVAAAVALSACTMMPKYEQPQVAVADTFKYDTVDDGIRAAELGWQDYFADPRLHRLIDIALERNTDLRTAALNAEIYRKQYMIARNDLLPSINASGTGTRVGSLSGGVTRSEYTVGLGAAAYELDLFGRVRSNSQAALQGYFSVAANRDAAHLALIAAVAKAHFNELYAQESMALAQRVLKTRETTYKLSQMRHKAGVISAVDLRQQEALIESAKADYANAVKNREQARNALATLINQPLPEDLPAALPLSKQFKITRLPAGLSSEVLLNRPDIRAAEHSLKQANANIGAARAAFFPTISLTGSVGTASGELSGLFKSGTGIWSFAPSITLPIFNWGSNKANLDVATLRKEAQIVAYEAAVQAAFQDVSNALVAREQLDKSYAALNKQSRAYNDTLRLINLRYKHGVSNALDLLDAERSSYGAETALLANQLTRLENLADLYKALGGGLKRETVSQSAAQQ
ncbi:TolC family protein [Neisseria sp. HMSC064E01]|uniref:efflux transporter outer membrane subunit n=1 Tax=Neisseria sp. HMSC064E01 TaxID=1715052 RepID=UPI0008A3AFF9|nr:TolC family protein [Neisseria sp. HMSC064E01]OFN82313.1 multidrug transporter [Neisseria sp. HMSC064E01]